MRVQWNSSHAQAHVNSSTCGSVEIGVHPTSGSYWATAHSSYSSGQPTPRVPSVTESGEVLFVGAWKGAPDGDGVEGLGGYYHGLIDSLEVCALQISSVPFTSSTARESKRARTTAPLTHILLRKTSKG